MQHCLLLQPRRRDFSRSSQGLPHLHPALHAAQHHSQPWPRLCAPDWHNTMLPRDPSWALPHPHQRPATAAAYPPPAFAHTAAEQSQGWSDSAHTYQHTSHQVAAPSGLSQRHCLDGTHQLPSTPVIAYEDDRAAVLDPHHLRGGWGKGGGGASRPQQWHDQDDNAHSYRWSPLDSAFAAATSRPVTAQHMLDARRHQTWKNQARMQQPVSQAQYTAGGLHSPHTARCVFPQPVSERLCVHSDEPVHQQGYLSQQPQSAQCNVAEHEHSRSCFEWSGCSPAVEQQYKEPASLLHQRAAYALKLVAPAAVYAGQPPGLAHKPCEDSKRSDLQVADDSNIAAMETVLSEYKALRRQISEAEAQLSALQRAPANHEAFAWPQSSSYSNEHASKPGARREAWSRDCDQGRGSGSDNAHWREVTNNLRVLKAAAAKQRPAVEAVASQLQGTLSRVHAACGK